MNASLFYLFATDVSSVGLPHLSVWLIFIMVVCCCCLSLFIVVILCCHLLCKISLVFFCHSSSSCYLFTTDIQFKNCHAYQSGWLFCVSIIVWCHRFFPSWLSFLLLFFPFSSCHSCLVVIASSLLLLLSSDAYVSHQYLQIWVGDGRKFFLKGLRKA